MLESKIIDTWYKQKDIRQKIIEEIAAFRELNLKNIEDRQRFIVTRLNSSIGNQGQNFEIISFAILNVYFSALGFSLRRFSTTFANDGGMDFISGEAFYQVTTMPTKVKIESDLSKLPKVQRVLVVPNNSLAAFTDIVDHVDVSEIVTRNDLVDHFLYWLYNRDKQQGTAKYLQKILDVAYNEYERE